MKKTIRLPTAVLAAAAAVFLLTTASLTAQNAPGQGGKMPGLAVAPFSGGAGDDGEAIAEMFSGSRDLRQVFDIYVDTSIAFGIDEERNIQKYVVSNKEYRNQLLERGVNYVVAGDITRLGRQNLLVISIIDIEKLVQIAGDVQIFEKPREIEGKLPEMTRNIIDGAKLDWTNKLKLAVVNPKLRDNADPEAANVLGEILGIEITRTGKYAVYPRNATLEAVQTEWNNQQRSEVDPKGPGNADRPEYVLSVIARGGEGSEMGARFNAAIQDMVGKQIEFTTQTYQKIEDGIAVMRVIAEELTITDAQRKAKAEEEERAVKAEDARMALLSAKERLNDVGGETRRQFAADYSEAETAYLEGEKAFNEGEYEAVQKNIEGMDAALNTLIKKKQNADDSTAARKKFLGDHRRFLSIGMSIGSSFTAPWLIGTVQGTFSVFKYTFFDIGCDFGFIHGYKGWENTAYHSFYPFAHFNGFVPFGGYGGWYVGAGGGYMMAFYSGNGEDNALYVPALDAATGLYLGKNHHYFTLAYTFRTRVSFEFKTVNHKVAVGYSYRFR